MCMYAAWIKIYYVLCSKTYSTFRNLLYSPSSLRQAATSSHICETRLFLTFVEEYFIV